MTKPFAPDAPPRRPGQRPRSPRGFTLIELTVTLALVGVLAMLSAPMAELAVQRSREHELRAALREIRTALDRYRRAVDQGQIPRKPGDSGYPPSLEVLALGVVNQADPKGAKLYLLRRVPRDPFHPDASVPAALTWGLRSYASPPDDPQPGDDVFDVHTTSSAVGLNGVPYRDW